MTGEIESFGRVEEANDEGKRGTRNIHLVKLKPTCLHLPLVRSIPPVRRRVCGRKGGQGMRGEERLN